MKKWCIILVLLLLLTGCGKQDTPVDRPPSLEVGYGDSSIYAQTNAYQWYWKDGRETDSAVVDASAMGIGMEKLPYVSAATWRRSTNFLAATTTRCTSPVGTGGDRPE